MEDGGDVPGASSSATAVDQASVDTNTLYIVPVRDCTSDQLNSIYSQYGSLTHVRVLPDKSTAFVGFADKDAAAAARKATDGLLQLPGADRALDVRYARKRQPKPRPQWQPGQFDQAGRGGMMGQRDYQQHNHYQAHPGQWQGPQPGGAQPHNHGQHRNHHQQAAHAQHQQAAYYAQHGQQAQHWQGAQHNPYATGPMQQQAMMLQCMGAMWPQPHAPHGAPGQGAGAYGRQPAPGPPASAPMFVPCSMPFAPHMAGPGGMGFVGAPHMGAYAPQAAAAVAARPAAPQAQAAAEEAPPAGCDADTYKLYIGNLPLAFTEQDVAALLEAEGCRAAEVALLRDRQTREFRGCAFVWCPTRAEADRASAALHGSRRLAAPAGSGGNGGGAHDAGGAPLRALVARKANPPRAGAPRAQHGQAGARRASGGNGSSAGAGASGAGSTGGYEGGPSSSASDTGTGAAAAAAAAPGGAAREVQKGGGAPEGAAPQDQRRASDGGPAAPPAAAPAPPLSPLVAAAAASGLGPELLAQMSMLLVQQQHHQQQQMAAAAVQRRAGASPGRAGAEQQMRMHMQVMQLMQQQQQHQHQHQQQHHQQHQQQQQHQQAAAGQDIPDPASPSISSYASGPLPGSQQPADAPGPQEPLASPGATDQQGAAPQTNNNRAAAGAGAPQHQPDMTRGAASPPRQVRIHVALGADQMAAVAPRLPAIEAASGAAAAALQVAPGLFSVELAGGEGEVRHAAEMVESALHHRLAEAPGGGGGGGAGAAAGALA